MQLRRTAPLALALLAIACQPDVPYNPAANPKQVNYAAFDPSASPPSIPLPNDLACLGIASQSPAQQVLLNTWCSPAGGFPSDQEVPITVDLSGSAFDAKGVATKVAPDIDVSTIKVNSADANVVVLAVDAQNNVTPVQLATPTAADYVKSSDHGTLSLHAAPTQNAAGASVKRWPAGKTLIYALKSGSGAIDVKGGGQPLQAQPAMYFITQCCASGTLADPQNQTLLPGATAAERAAVGAQLEVLRQKYLPAFAALDASPIHHNQVATMGTFKVAAALGPHVETDPGSGLVPLPSDLLFENGHLSPSLAAASGPFGPLGAGLSTLDGFSTTAMVLSQVSEPIDASTVAGGAFIYQVDTTSNPPFKRVYEIAEALANSKPPQYVAQPTPIVQSGASVAIGLQPAVPVPVGAGVALPPLKEGTTYVVLITDSIKTIAATGAKPLVRTTFANLLFLDPSISIASNGKSTVAGVTDAQAVGLDQMRVAIRGAAAVLAAEKPALTINHVVMGYTFKTQTMKATAVKLAELPYGTPTSTVNPVAAPTTYCASGCAGGTIDAAFARYGVETTTQNATGGVPTAGIFTIVEAPIVTFNALDPNTGAFLDLTNSANQPAAEQITALIALPTPACGTPPCSVPLVVFRHGFGSSRGAMLTVASTLTSNGIAVAAIDMVKHGDRSFCSANNQCASGGTCTPNTAFANQGDAVPPGKCTTDFVRAPVLCPSGTCAAAPAGTPLVSSNYLVSANFFRTRDSFRQDIIDESQLIRVLAPNPAAPSPNAVTSALGISIDPTKIWYVGQSLGSINGTVSVAANARVSKAVLNVGGGTAVDVFSQSPAFATSTNQLLASLGITPGTAAYLQFINVAKWILDPAEPLNFAVNLNASTLPSALTGGAAPPGRAILSQLANCDVVVPNPFNFELTGNIGTGTGVASQILVRPGNYSALPNGLTTCPTPELSAGAGAIPHAILTDWGFNNSATDAGLHGFTQTIQSDLATWLTTGAAPTSPRIAP